MPLITVSPDGTTLGDHRLAIRSYPNIYAVEDTVHHTFVGTPNSALYHSLIVDRQESTPQLVFARESHQAHFPAVATGPNGELHVVFYGLARTESRNTLFYQRSVDAGVTWSAPMNLQESGSLFFIAPSLFVDTDGGVHIISTFFGDAGLDASGTPVTTLVDNFYSFVKDGVPVIKAETVFQSVNALGPAFIASGDGQRGLAYLYGEDGYVYESLLSR